MRGGNVEWLPRTMIASVLVETALALILTYGAGVGPLMPVFNATLLVLVLSTVAFADLVIVRFVVLPRLAASEGKERQTALSLGSSYPAASGIFGLAVAIVTGRGLIVLPFTVAALLTFYVLLSYVDEEWPKGDP